MDPIDSNWYLVTGVIPGKNNNSATVYSTSFSETNTNYFNGICPSTGSAVYNSSIEDTLENYGLTSLASGFFWLIVFATLIGVILSFTKIKSYEGAGASKMGSLFLYVLVAAIGTHMDLAAIAESPILFAIGGIWMLIHALFLILVAFIIKAPFFFVAVGSQANVGGAASAPVVASAFHPSLAPVGVLLAVMGYAVGTGAAWLCAVLMQNIV